MNKTYSQKLARFYEIASYVFLFLGICTASFFVLLAFLFTHTDGPETTQDGFDYVYLLLIIIPLLPVVLIFLFAVTLLVGYFRHSRGRLSAGMTTVMWIATSVYTLMFLLLRIYFFLTFWSFSFQTLKTVFFDFFSLSGIFTLLLTILNILLIILPITAIVSNQKVSEKLN